MNNNNIEKNEKEAESPLRSSHTPTPSQEGKQEDLTHPYPSPEGKFTHPQPPLKRGNCAHSNFQFSIFNFQLIKLAFMEDIGDGDHTTLCCIPETAMGKSQLIIKEDGVLAGVEMAECIFHEFDPTLKLTVYLHDGDEVKKGDVAFVVEGKVQSLLQTERLVLNVMQRMSGIATTTRRYVKALEGTGTRVLDTRKTTPGMRMMEKDAVRIGGGVNHRIGLFDMILLKDNHVDFAGGIEPAITRAKNYLKEKGKDLKIEIEVRNFDELEQALQTGGIDRIMLDNFSVEDTREAVKRIAGRYETESSGGITFDTLRQYAETGVNYISVGALTHSIKSLDMSLKAV